eukprot:1147343-Pelagomonas_calceolata.AAC.5
MKGNCDRPPKRGHQRECLKGISFMLLLVRETNGSLSQCTMLETVTMGGDLQLGRLADRLVAGTVA